MSRIIIHNGAEAVEAEYKEQIIEEYNDNPFIQALPSILSSEEVVDKLVIYPKHNKEERMLENQYRIHLTQRLFQCFQPLMIHLDLESRISRVIRQGYLARNPFRTEYSAAFHQEDGGVKTLGFEISSNSVFRTTASGFSIVGVSGMGKTTAINRILSMYPQIIVHSQYKETNFSMYQLVWLKLDCPFDGSLKGLCIQFFNKVDSLLGTDYYRKFGIGRKTVDNMLSIMQRIVQNTGLGLLVIDEIQHLNQAKSGGDEKMLNFFVTLVNMIGVPLVLIGTMKALSIFQSEFRQARRGSGQGDMIWERLKKDKGWNLLVNALWDYQWTRKEIPLTEEFIDVLYEESQGIVDIAVKLYAMAQVRGIMSGKEEITVNLIKQVGKENLRLVRPMIEALKSNDIKQIAKYEDICTLDFEDFLNNEKPKFDLENRVQELKKAREQKEKADNLSLKEQVILKLIDIGIDANKAQKSVEKIIGEIDGQISVGEAVIKAIHAISEPKVNNSSNNKNNKPKCNIEGDLRCAIEEGRKNNLSAYEIFKEKGYIKNADTDILKVG